MSLYNLNTHTVHLHILVLDISLLAVGAHSFRTFSENALHKDTAFKFPLNKNRLHNR